MKIRHLFLTIPYAVIGILAAPNTAHCASATYCSVNTSGNTDSCPDCTAVTQIITCLDATYCDCSACKNNGTPTSKTIQTGALTYTTISECPKSLSGGGEIIGGTCPDECPTTTWTDVSGQKYQTRCDGYIFNPSCEYQCNKGYWGSGTSCAQCPSSGGVYGTTADAGATAITECYIPAGTVFSDSTGSGTYTEDCYYNQ